jgi:type IV secretion system protein VirB10
MRVHIVLPLVACALLGQDAATEPQYKVEIGTRVPLSLINTISTKNAAEGDRVYLESVFPVMGDGRIIIPPGSYVAGTVTQVKRPGRVKGRGELYVRFDSLTLPNGVTRDFRGRIGALDGSSNDKLDRTEGKVTSDSDKSGDAKKIGEAAVTGTTIGAIAGAAGGSAGMGTGIGAAAGATAGLVGVLLSRGPEAILAKGSTLEMVLDRELTFTQTELEFAPAARRPGTAAPPPAAATSDPGFPLPGRRQ